MAVDNEDMSRLVTEIVLGVPAGESTVPPSAEVTAMRAQLAAEIADMPPGTVVDNVHEWPHIQVPAKVDADHPSELDMWSAWANRDQKAQ